MFFRPARVSGGRRGACVNRGADVQDQEKDDAHASEEEEEEEERRMGDDEGKKPPPNNHDLHRNEKAVPASSEEMTRRCFLVNCFSELRKLNCLPATENRKSAGLR